MKTQVDALVSNYLERLADSLAPLPRPRRRQLLTEIAEHIDHARQGLDPDDEIGLLGVLDAVGDPETIAEEALGVAFGDRASLRTDRVERLVPWLVCFGGFVFGVGWLAGMALLWTSAAWRVRDKLLATLVVPGGLLLPVLPARDELRLHLLLRLWRARDPDGQPLHHKWCGPSAAGGYRRLGRHGPRTYPGRRSSQLGTRVPASHGQHHVHRRARSRRAVSGHAGQVSTRPRPPST